MRVRAIVHFLFIIHHHTPFCTLTYIHVESKKSDPETEADSSGTKKWDIPPNYEKFVASKCPDGLSLVCNVCSKYDEETSIGDSAKYAVEGSIHMN